MFKKIYISKIIAFVFLFSLLISPALSLAQQEPKGSQSVFERMSGGAKNAINFAYGGGGEVTVTDQTLLGTIIILINVLLTFVGIVFFVVLLYGGYLWMTARGNDEQLQHAKKITREVIIGLIIIIVARLVTEFVLQVAIDL